MYGGVAEWAEGGRAPSEAPWTMRRLVPQRGGGLAEWSMATVLKTVRAQVLVGSNPTPSATRRDSVFFVENFLCGKTVRVNSPRGFESCPHRDEKRYFSQEESRQIPYAQKEST